MSKALEKTVYWPLLPVLLVFALVPGYLGGVTMFGRNITLLAIAVAALLTCWQWFRRPGLLSARLSPWRYLALMLIVPIAFAALRLLAGPVSVPGSDASWADGGPFGGVLSPTSAGFHVLFLSALLLTGLMAFLAAGERHAARALMAIVLGVISVWSIISLGVYYAGHEFGEIVTAIDRPRYRFLSGPFVNRAHFGSFAGAGAVIAAALLAERLHQDRKRFLEAREQGFANSFGPSVLTAALAGIIILMMVAVLETAARGALIASGLAMLAVAVVFAMRGRGRERIARLAFIGAAIVAVLPVLWLIAGDNLEKRMPYQSLAGDFSERRFDLWRPGLEALGERPVTGWGLGNYGQVSRIYAQENLGVRIERAHNEYLDLAVGWGIPATLLWIGGLAWLAWCCLRGALARHRDWGLPLAAVALTVHFAVHSLVDFPLYIPANALLFALILGTGFAQISSSRQGGSGRMGKSKHERHRKKTAEPETQFLRVRTGEPGRLASRPIYAMSQARKSRSLNWPRLPLRPAST